MIRPKDGLGEGGVVDGVGEELRLQAHGVVVGVGHAALAAFAADEVTGVDLHAWRVREHVHGDAAPVARKRRHSAQCAHEALVVGRWLRLAQSVVVVIAARARNGSKARLDACAQRLRLAQVERGATDREQTTGGHEVVARLGVGVGKHLKRVVERRSRSVTVQVEVAVVGEVHHRRRVGQCHVGDGELVCGREPVGHPHVEVAGEALVSVRALEAELDEGTVLAPLGADKLPKAVMPIVRPAVQTAAAVVSLRRIGGAAKLKVPGVDAVGVTAHHGAKVGPVDGIACGPVVAQHDVREAPGFVWRAERDEASPQVGDLGRHAMGVGEAPQARGLAVGHGAKGDGGDGGGHGCSCSCGC